MKRITSTEITSRTQFGSLCNTKGVRVAVEVGTDLGVFAKQFMATFGGHELICVDNYSSYEWLNQNRLPDLLMAINALQPWHGRVRIVQANSIYVARNLPNHLACRIDFVYVDASHDYGSVKADLDVWWDVLQPGGILAGHDYSEDHEQVVRAVDEFIESKGVDLYLVEEDSIPSWYCYKPDIDNSNYYTTPNFHRCTYD